MLAKTCQVLGTELRLFVSGGTCHQLALAADNGRFPSIIGRSIFSGLATPAVGSKIASTSTPSAKGISLLE
jgi:hypothetical protein